MCVAYEAAKKAFVGKTPVQSGTPDACPEQVSLKKAEGQAALMKEFSDKWTEVHPKMLAIIDKLKSSQAVWCIHFFK